MFRTGGGKVCLAPGGYVWTGGAMFRMGGGGERLLPVRLESARRINVPMFRNVGGYIWMRCSGCVTYRKRPMKQRPGSYV
eukprot:scaffold14320_cov48-Isochrysis_galbana.AAC.1